MPYTIESDKSRQLKWVVREDTDVSLTITVTLSGSPFNLSSYTFVTEIFKIGGSTPILSLTQGSGITNNGAAGTLVLALTDTQLNITPNEYYWRLRTTAPTDNVWFNGVFQVNGYLYDSSADNSVSVALTIGGDDLSVTLTLSGAGTLQQAYDNGDGTVTLTPGKPFDIISDSGVTLFRIRDSGTRILVQSASGMLLATIAGNAGMTAAGDLFISSSATGGNKTLTTVGGNIFAIPNPSAIKLIRINANNTVEVINPNEFIGIACSDETTVLAAASTSVPIATFHAPYALLLTRVFAGLRTAGTGAAVVTVDIHVNGTTIMSGTKILFTASQKLSADGVISTTSIAAGDYVEIFLDQRDTDNVATGLKTYLVGYKNS